MKNPNAMKKKNPARLDVSVEVGSAMKKTANPSESTPKQPIFGPVPVTIRCAGCTGVTWCGST
jgi:hypothetical protein